MSVVLVVKRQPHGSVLQPVGLVPPSTLIQPMLLTPLGPTLSPLVTATTLLSALILASAFVVVVLPVEVKNVLPQVSILVLSPARTQKPPVPVAAQLFRSHPLLKVHVMEAPIIPPILDPAVLNVAMDVYTMTTIDKNVVKNPPTTTILLPPKPTF